MKKVSLFLAVLLSIILSIIVILNIPMDQSNGAEIEASQGKIDISGVSANKLTPLNGEWAFYYQKLLKPAELSGYQPTAYVTLPGMWSEYEYEKGKAFPRQGYGTFRLTIKMKKQEAGTQKALYIPIFNTAYELYIDGKYAGGAGKIGTSKEAMRPQYLPQTYYFTPKADTVDVVIQTSNFYHMKSGIRHEMIYGDASLVSKMTDKQIVKDSFLIGVFLLITIYHISFYFNKKREVRSLVFGIISFVIAVRISLIRQALLYQFFPNFHWTLGLKIEYLTVTLGFFFYSIFFKTLYPQEANAIIYRLSLLVTGAFSVCVLLAPPTVFGHLLIPTGAVALLLVIYFSYVLILVVVRRYQGVMISFITGLFFAYTGIHDIFLYTGFIESTDMVPLGFFVFLFSQFIMLVNEYAKSFNEADRLNLELKELNEHLEDRVSAQTKSLEKAMKETAVALADKKVLQERNRIIGEIHDTVGHTLTSIIIQIEAGKRLIQKNASLAIEKLDISQGQVRQGLNDIRRSLRIIKENHTVIADDLHSIESLVFETEKNMGVTIESDIRIEASLSEPQQQALYHALQEGLTNGVRHGRSKNFKFSLYSTAESIIFKLEDDGEGTDTDELKYGIGMTAMQERVAQLDGMIRIDSKKGEGFMIEIRLPLDPSLKML